jgi:toxin FitB
MIVLDTNVVSEPLKPSPDAGVLAWLDRQAPETLYLSAVTVAELLEGVSRLPDGKRKAELAAAITQAVLPLFKGRILPFDEAAACALPGLLAQARSQGVTLGVADAYIAAIAASRGFPVATRDTAPFATVGVAVINPWAQA